MLQSTRTSTQACLLPTVRTGLKHILSYTSRQLFLQRKSEGLHPPLQPNKTFRVYARSLEGNHLVLVVVRGFGGGVPSNNLQVDVTLPFCSIGYDHMLSCVHFLMESFHGVEEKTKVLTTRISLH